MWIVPLVIAIIGAVFFMNNLTSARSTFKDQLAIVKRKHTWIMSYIYIGYLLFSATRQRSRF